ncbi:MAG: flippase [Anaerostipes hadrus]
MRDRKVIKNYIFNTSYQLLALIVPLITTPYISRVLRADGIGTYSYTYSIVCYFTLCAILGTATYGNKQIGILQDKEIERTKKFWDIFSLRFITSLIALIIYILYVVLFSANKQIAFLQSFYILGVMFDVSWFFQGMEDFRRIAIRNYIIKIINVIIIFMFIHNENDLWKYVFSLAFLTWLGNISIWPYLKKYIVSIKKYRPKPFEDINVVIQLFIPTAALQIYAMLDKTMIGSITQSSAQNGYYEQSEKIVKMCLMLVTALPTVLLPKVSKAYAEKRLDDAKQYLYKAYNFVWFLGTPLMFGVMGISTVLVPIFFGKGYEAVIYILPVMSLLFITMGLNQTSGTQFFIASGRQNEYTTRIILGGILNVIINAILIPRLGALGAAVGSVLGEIAITMMEFAYIQKNRHFSIRKVILNSVKYAIAGIFMLVILKILGNYFNKSAIDLAILIITGGISYFLILLIEKEQFTLLGVNIIFNKIIHR